MENKKITWIVLIILGIIILATLLPKGTLFVAEGSCPYTSPYANTCEKFVQSKAAWISGQCSISFMMSEISYIKTFPNEFARVIGDGASCATTTPNVQISNLDSTRTGNTLQMTLTWTGGVMPYTVEVEGEELSIYQENINNNLYTFTHTYSKNGIFDVVLCVYDSSENTENDCNTFYVNVSTTQQPTTCTEANWIYELSPCVNNQQTKSWTRIGNCINGVQHPSGELVSCNSQVPQCTNFTYTAYGSCINGTQSRTILTSSPSGCTGGSPITSKVCTQPSEGNFLMRELVNLNGFSVKWWMALALVAAIIIFALLK